MQTRFIPTIVTIACAAAVVFLLSNKANAETQHEAKVRYLAEHPIKWPEDTDTGIVGVSKCTIKAGMRLPVGPELEAAQRKCYFDILPAEAAAYWYHQSKLDYTYTHDVNVNITVYDARCRPRTGAGATAPLPHCK